MRILKVTERNTGGFFFKYEAYVKGCLDPKPNTSSCLGYVIFMASLLLFCIVFPDSLTAEFLQIFLVLDDFLI